MSVDFYDLLTAVQQMFTEKANGDLESQKTTTQPRPNYHRGE